MYEIVVIMAMLATDPKVYPGKDLKQEDALRITHNNGVPLVFKNIDICYEHVWANLEKIKKFASSEFDGAPVKHIVCAPVQEDT